MNIVPCTQHVFCLDSGPSQGSLRPAVEIAKLVSGDTSETPTSLFIVYGYDGDGDDWPTSGRQVAAIVSTEIEEGCAVSASSAMDRPRGTDGAWSAAQAAFACGTPVELADPVRGASTKIGPVVGGGGAIRVG